ncbi:GntR family transcriptional regulator [Microbacterium karelineae]|uniref:GntR family transcriptional regulator n=1 Tax=Microbacterium karelineae TaxID=2654283 RepID=UPI0012EA97EF|nr:GntR family transcriptional regulator [Microbacterium karelineae]
MPPSSTPRPSLADQAYGILLDRLVMLDIAPGDPINETSLTAELGVGRTPVREALKRLESEHLVQSFPRRGTFAARAEISDLRSITEMRLILEPAGTRKAADDADDAQREQLRALASDIAALRTSDPSLRTLLEFDLATHRAIYRLVENAYMREVLFRLDNQATRLWWSVIEEVPSVADHIAGHHALLTAVADGDPGTAAELAQAHVAEFHAQLQAALLRSAAL